MFDWVTGMDWLLEVEALGRLALAIVLGAVIGLERERRDKSAGLRTVLLVCVGAELFTEASLWAASMELTGMTRADPARIAAQVVTGVGFLGAGAILVQRGRVVGLTTAAAIWVAAAIGMTVGLRLYLLAVSGTAAVMLTLTWVRRIEDRLIERASTTLEIRMEAREGARARIEDRIDGLDVDWKLTGLARDEDELTLRYHLSGAETARDRLPGELLEEPFVTGLELN